MMVGKKMSADWMRMRMGFCVFMESITMIVWRSGYLTKRKRLMALVGTFWGKTWQCDWVAFSGSGNTCSINSTVECVQSGNTYNRLVAPTN